MKNFLFIAMILAYTFTFGQNTNEKLTIPNGTWNFGGNISFNTSEMEIENSSFSNSERKSYTISFEPKISYAIKNNLFIGIGLGYGYSKDESITYDIDTESISTTNIWSIIPYIKKYFPVGKKLTLNLKGEFRYSSFESDYDNSNFISSANNYFIGIRPGITYFLNNKIALDANIGSLGYWNSKVDDNSNNTQSSGFELSIDTSNFYFGVSYFL
ncbi:porin family protein [Lutibacter sp. A80]|uniref:porin family protein n=1 Tax=Lutibacter sp. A80 TaxID=2918453 RepID=UPI001F0516A0|nr:porin family protein [Lutibacter sp. A80]UMB61191.1 porin family protein [Lutibacter sp. A80]